VGYSCCSAGPGCLCVENENFVVEGKEKHVIVILAAGCLHREPEKGTNLFLFVALSKINTSKHFIHHAKPRNTKFQLLNA